MIRVDRLNISTVDENLVQNMKLSIKEGDMVVFTGDSGTGKTTLVQSLLYEEPKTVAVDGYRFMKPNLRVAWVHQQNDEVFNPLRTIGGHIKDVCKSLGIPFNQQHLKPLLEKLSLDPTVLKKRPFECSGGMRQRIQILLALIVKPDVIVADEPTTALEPALKKKVIHLFKQTARERGTAFLIISHERHYYAGFPMYELKEGRMKKVEWIKPKYENPPATPLGREIIKIEDGSVSRVDRSLLFKRERKILTDIHLQLKQGEIIGIAGRSGSGKTTFLEALRNNKVTRANIVPECHYVPQNIALSLKQDWLVRDVVKEACNVHPYTEGELERLLHAFRLNPSILSKQVDQCSGGMQQRVAIMRAVMQKPDVLLLDEPFSNLDDDTMTTLMKILLKMRADYQMSMIIVCHDPVFIQTYADQIFTVENGTLIKEEKGETNHYNTASMYAATGL